MTHSLLLINIPFPISTKKNVVINVSPQMLVSDSIREVLELQIPGMGKEWHNYSLFIEPQNGILHPSIRLFDYRNQIISQEANSNNSPQPKLSIVPKVPCQSIFTILYAKVIVYHDRYQTVEDVVRQIAKSKKIFPKYLNSIENYMVFFEKTPVNPKSKFVELSDTKFSEKRHFKLRREMSKPIVPCSNEDPNALCHRQNITIFKGNINDALALDNYTTEIPFFLVKILSLIEQNKDTVGIYRLSGDYTMIDQIVKRIETAKTKTELYSFLENQKVHELTGTIKLYLRQLKDPLISSFLEQEFRNLLSMNNETQKLQILKILISSLPLPNYKLLFYFCRHLEKIIESSVNQMNAKNLAICLGPCIFRVPPGDAAIKETENSQIISGMIFENWRYLFLDASIDQKNTNYKVVKPIIIPNLGIIQVGSIVQLIESPQNCQIQFNAQIDESSGNLADIRPILFNNISINVDSSSIKANNPVYTFLNLEFSPFEKIKDVFQAEYLVPENINYLYYSDSKAYLAQQIDRVSLYENEFDKLGNIIANNPNDIEARKKLQDLILLFNKENL